VAEIWHPGYDESGATRVTLTVTTVADGTEVALTHSEWHDQPSAVEGRAGDDTGWTYVLGRYVAHGRGSRTS
jgi:hypothetical protein